MKEATKTIIRIDRKTLAGFYGMSKTTFFSYLAEHQHQLNRLASFRKNGKKKVRSRDLNTEQLEYIVTVIFKYERMEGYIWNADKKVIEREVQP